MTCSQNIDGIWTRYACYVLFYIVFLNILLITDKLVISHIIWTFLFDTDNNLFIQNYFTNKIKIDFSKVCCQLLNVGVDFCRILRTIETANSKQSSISLVAY